MRKSVALVVLLVACQSRGACVSTYPGVAGNPPFVACRQDLDSAACASETATSTFTPGARCVDVRFPCAHDEWGAVLSDRMSGGTCPPGTTEMR